MYVHFYILELLAMEVLILVFGLDLAGYIPAYGLSRSSQSDEKVLSREFLNANLISSSVPFDLDQKSKMPK